MGRIKTAAKKLVKSLYGAYYYYVIRKGTCEKLNDARQLWEQVTLTDEQVKEIESVYGSGIDTRWHRHYQYYTGKFDAQYFPEIIYSPVLETKLCPLDIAREMEDKSKIPVLYGSVPGVKIPKTVILNASGIYYDGDNNVITQENAEKLVRQYLQEHEEAILKPTRETGGGEGVVVFQKESVVSFCKESNFIVQERIINQDDLRALNPSSLNTMRVITYICDEQYWCAPIALRIGCGTSRLDNICSGGMSIGVREDGELCPEAYIENLEVRYREHPYTKIKFEGYRIKNIDKIIDAAIACHKRTPHMRIASWDLTLDDGENAVLIEVNLTGQSVCFPQYTHGKSLFGENTRKMLEFLQ